MISGFKDYACDIVDRECLQNSCVSREKICHKGIRAKNEEMR